MERNLIKLKQNNQSKKILCLLFLIFFYVIQTNAQYDFKIEICDDFCKNSTVNMFIIINKIDTIYTYKNYRNEFYFLKKAFVVEKINFLDIHIKKNKYEYIYNLEQINSFLLECNNVRICVRKIKRNLYFEHRCYHIGVTGFMKKKRIPVRRRI